MLKSLLFAFATAVAAPQTVSIGSGSLILSGAGEPHGDPAVLARFVALAGGPDAEIVYIPSAATGIRLPSGFVAELPETGEILPSREALEVELAKLFGVRAVRILHTRDQIHARSEAFAAPVKSARAVWLGYGNAGRLADLFLDTPVATAIKGVLKRGGVVGGNSAGAIIQGAFIVRGRSDKPVLMARGHEKGFALLPGTAVNPHLTSAKREDELVSVIDQHPELLGLGLEDSAALLVQGSTAEVLGTGRVAVYDNSRHDRAWYYWLPPGSRFDLKARRALEN